MKKVNTITKCQQVREQIRKLLGSLSQEEALPSELALANGYGVSRFTVSKAISELAAEGLLYRIQGKGTFPIQKQNGSTVENTNIIGLLIPSHGHLFEAMTMSLVKNIQSQGFHSLIINTCMDECSKNEILSRIRELLNAHPAGLIFDAFLEFPYYDVFEQYKDEIKNLTIIYRNENKHAPRTTSVLTDDVHGGYIATKHLLSLGHKRILFIPSQPRNLQNNSTGRRIMNGCLKALGEKNIICPDEYFFDRDIKNLSANEDRLYSIFSSEDRPTAVFAFGDSLMCEVQKAISRAGLKVPDDVSLVGYFNTPWSEKLNVPLTSVCIREQELARVAVEKNVENIKFQDKKTGNIIVKPELVVRDSTTRVKQV